MLPWTISRNRFWVQLPTQESQAMAQRTLHQTGEGDINHYVINPDHEVRWRSSRPELCVKWCKVKALGRNTAWTIALVKCLKMLVQAWPHAERKNYCTQLETYDVWGVFSDIFCPLLHLLEASNLAWFTWWIHLEGLRPIQQKAQTFDIFGLTFQMSVK